MNLQAFQAILKNICEQLLLRSIQLISQDIRIIHLNELKKILLLFALTPAPCNFVKNGLDHRCFCFLKV